MIQDDVALWALITVPVGLALCIGANAASDDSAVPPFGWLNNEHNWASIFDTIENFFLMSFVGEPSDVVDPGTGRGGAPYLDSVSIYPSERVMRSNCEGGDCKRVLGVVFFVCYVTITIMLPLVLVNLLIAMMGNTYSNTIASARLEGRVKFARLVLSLELKVIGLPRDETPFLIRGWPGASHAVPSRDLNFKTAAHGIRKTLVLASVP